MDMVIPLASFTWVLRQGLFLDLELDWLAIKPQRATHFRLSSTRIMHMPEPAQQAFYTGSGLQSHIPLLAQQAFYQPTKFPKLETVKFQRLKRSEQADYRNGLTVLSSKVLSDPREGPQLHTWE